MKKSMRDLFKTDEVPVGCWSFGENPTDIELLGLSGYDFVIIDDEHGCHNDPNKLELVRTAENAGIMPLFRVPGFTYEDSIKKVLDIGASGIVVPNISRREEAEQAIQYSKFAPIGNRGACPYVRANFWGTKYSVKEYYSKANEEVTVIFLIENTGGVKNFDEIISVEGVDAILYGRADLSVSMGIPGEYENPELLESIKSMTQRARAKGVPAGMVAFDYDDAMRWLADDVDFLTAGFNLGGTIMANRELVNKIKDQG